MPHNTQQQWVRQPRSLPGVHIPQGSFSFVEFELQLIFQNCQLADSNLFSLLYSTFSWVAMSLWPKRVNWKCWGLWESSPISFASSCLKQECDARSCDRLSAIVRKGPRESQRYQLTALTSLNYWTDITNYLTPHFCHVRNISPYCWSGPLLLAAESIPNWYNWQKLIPAVFGLTLDLYLYLGKITSIQCEESLSFPWELGEKVKENSSLRRISSTFSNLCCILGYEREWEKLLSMIFKDPCN